jgi:hypothetical protein
MNDRVKPGRPAHQPSEQARKTVEAMASYGIRHEEIAAVLDMDDKTLRKYYRRELDIASTKANAMVAQTLFGIATDRNHPKCATSAIFWLKTRAKWREAPAITEDSDFDPVPEVLGKKAQAARDAETAGQGTDWGDLLTPPGMMN